jgi:hypothetical protein
MTIRTALAALVLAAVPAVGWAGCNDGHRNMSTSSCAEGQTWDATTQTCVPVTSS